MVGRICSSACAVLQSLLSGSQAEPSCVQAFCDLDDGLTSSTILSLSGVHLHCHITHWRPVTATSTNLPLGPHQFALHTIRVTVCSESNMPPYLSLWRYRSKMHPSAEQQSCLLHLHRMSGNVLWKPTGDVTEVSCHTNSLCYESYFVFASTIAHSPTWSLPVISRNTLLQESVHAFSVSTRSTSCSCSKS